VEELYLSSAQPGRPKIRYLFSPGRAYSSTHICTPPPSQISPPTRQCPTRPCPLARVDSRRWHPRPVLLRPSQGGAHRPCASQRPAPLALPCGLSTPGAPSPALCLRPRPAPPLQPDRSTPLVAPAAWRLPDRSTSPTDDSSKVHDVGPLSSILHKVIIDLQATNSRAIFVTLPHRADQ
jgi:hypothetical protein